MAKNRKVGGERAGYAGAYSRSYPKVTEPTWFKNYRTTSATWVTEYRPEDRAGFGGRDISAKVEANSRNASAMSVPSLPGGPGGFSGLVSKGNRPKHKAGRA